MKHTLFHGSLAFSFSLGAMAADAVFSPDGQSVTLLDPSAVTFVNPPPGPVDLWRVNLKTKAIEKLKIDLPKDQRVVSIAAGAEGELLLLTDKAVYVQNAKGTKKVCDTTGVEHPGSLATAPPK